MKKTISISSMCARCTVAWRTGLLSIKKATSKTAPLSFYSFGPCRYCGKQHITNPVVLPQYRHLTPGGWIEQAEINPKCRSATDPFPPDSMWIECGTLATECGELFGKTMFIEETMTSLIEQAGFVDVIEKRFRWPFGTWAEDKRLKDIGRWQLHHWEEGLEGWTMALMTRCLGVSDRGSAPRFSFLIIQGDPRHLSGCC